MSNTREDSKIHALAQFFAVRSQCDGVVLLTNDYLTAIVHYPASAMIFLLQTSTTHLSPEEIKKLPANVAVLTMKAATSGVLKNKVFVCADYLEGKTYRFGSHEHRHLRSAAHDAALSILSVEQSAYWNAGKLKRLLHANKTALIGHQPNGNLLAISGRLSDVYQSRYPTLPVLAVVSQFNEIDIIEPVVNYLLNQGVDVHVIDNWSDDGSYEAVEEISRLNPKRVSVERFPKQNTHKYEWTKILTRVTEVAKDRPQYKWIVSNDADEIRWSPWLGVSLQKAISFIDHCGFNVIDYTVFNFYPTRDGYRRGTDPLEFFEYGDFGHEGWHFMQLKAWRNNPAADIASSSGHLVKIPDAKIFPLKFLLGHYSLRSGHQARKKVFKDRKPRFLVKERRAGWHSHYDKINDEQTFIKEKKGLIVFSNSSQFLEKYLIERISGINIKINKINRR